MRCIYCNAPTYLLGNGYRKCKKCKRKFSPAKIARKEKIVKCFCENLSVNECMRRSGYNYVTIKSYYDAFRKKIAAFMEEEYLNRQETRAYEEYIYLESSKDPKKDIFDGYNFLTFDYGGRIYNLLMPDLSRFKPYFSEDGLNEVYYKEFKNFLRISKLQKNSQNRLIYDFWSYLEDLLPKYRGIKRENFFYYLKEAEFKFNFDCEKLKEIV
ncbi:hypothetical protein NitYY0826_C1255 [Nitratiruptor sp. YY08-26]|uniref:hypothetical protein n=1 Tax=unclassified Nitratiruptor TaxID=2624044 RepID=UPI001915F1B9|nr:MULTISPECIES: hypothetical protein [unclassified Nitratiruptor]BCD62379.1 hypothetical protein NitYY0813_C1253 [Nitratiruptor sp. YY08-13]BCD66315.1 hypothetical protein NitYY0826_C1255 [Nitratiruptor sp. YY08-26]